VSFDQWHAPHVVVPQERSMQFMLLIHADETRPLPSPPVLAELQAAYGAFAEDLARSGHMRGGARLAPSLSSTTLRGTEAHAGPPSSGGEQLAGYYVVECADLAEALAIAARVPALRMGEAVEVRAIVPVSAP
jgi:hypothetical protein